MNPQDQMADKRNDTYLDKAHSVLDFAKSLVNFSDPLHKQTPLYGAYLEALSRLEAVKCDIARRRKKQFQTINDSRYPPQLPPSREPYSPLSTNAECVEVSTTDGSALSVAQVERYFASFGTITWCRQSPSASTVLFCFVDPALIKNILEFNHRIQQKPVRLKTINEDSSISSACLAFSSAIINEGQKALNNISSFNARFGSGTNRPQEVVTDSSPLTASSPGELTRFIDQLANSVRR